MLTKKSKNILNILQNINSKVNLGNNEKNCHKQSKEYWKSWQMDQSISEK